MNDAEVPLSRPHIPLAYCGLPEDQAVYVTEALPLQRQAHLQLTSPPHEVAEEAKQVEPAVLLSPIQALQLPPHSPAAKLESAAEFNLASEPPGAREAQAVEAAAKVDRLDWYLKQAPEVAAEKPEGQTAGAASATSRVMARVSRRAPSAEGAITFTNICNRNIN